MDANASSLIYENRLCRSESNNVNSAVKQEESNVVLYSNQRHSTVPSYLRSRPSATNVRILSASDLFAPKRHSLDCLPHANDDNHFPPSSLSIVTPCHSEDDGTEDTFQEDTMDIMEEEDMIHCELQEFHLTSANEKQKTNNNKANKLEKTNSLFEEDVCEEENMEEEYDDGEEEEEEELVENRAEPPRPNNATLNFTHSVKKPFLELGRLFSFGSKKVDRPPPPTSLPLSQQAQQTPSSALVVSTERPIETLPQKSSSFPSNVNDLPVANGSHYQFKEALQNRLRFLWNNVKFDWSIKLTANFNAKIPIFLLGRKYHQSVKGLKFFNIENESFCPVFESFLKDFSSRLWFSYRYSFPPIPGPPESSGSSFDSLTTRRIYRTSDSGWGCMLRSAQSLMAQGLLIHFLSRDWSLFMPSNESHSRTAAPLILRKTPTMEYNNGDSSASPMDHPLSLSRGLQRSESTPMTSLTLDKALKDNLHSQIVSWFADSPRSDCPFSIHHLVSLSGHPAGQWFGPASACSLLQRAIRSAHVLKHPTLLSQVDVYVAEDRQIFIQDIRRLFCVNHNDHNVREFSDLKTPADPPCCSRGLMILLPLYLGGSQGFQGISYTNMFRRLFEEPNCLGVIGGRPKHSLYFVGIQGNELIHLDPHYSQAVVDIDQNPFPTETYHCYFPRKMSINKLDPSCAVGFYCRSPGNLDHLLNNMAKIQLTDKFTFPLLEILPGEKPKYDELYSKTKQICKSDQHDNQLLSSSNHRFNSNNATSATNTNTRSSIDQDDFVLL